MGITVNADGLYEVKVGNDPTRAFFTEQQAKNYAERLQQALNGKGAIPFSNMTKSELEAFIGNNTNSKAARDVAQQVWNQRFPQTQGASIYSNTFKAMTKSELEAFIGNNTNSLDARNAAQQVLNQRLSQASGANIYSNTFKAMTKSELQAFIGNNTNSLDARNAAQQVLNQRFPQAPVANSGIYPTANGQEYAKMLEQNGGQGSGNNTSKKPGLLKRIGNKAKGFWNKLGKCGKAAVIVGAIGLAALGISALFKGCSDKKEVVPVKEETQPTTPVEPTPETPVEPTPVEPVQPTPVEPTPVTPVPPESLNDDGIYTVQEKESFYSIAEKLLKEYCTANNIDKHIDGNSIEVAKLANDLMKNHAYAIQDTSEAINQDPTRRMSKPILHPGINLTVPDLGNYVKKDEEVKIGEQLNLAA